MGMYVLKAIALAGVVLNVFLMLRKQKELRSSTEVDPEVGLTGEEQWKKGMKNAPITMVIGIVANFFDTLGIGSFAPTSTALKLTKTCDDINIPGTLNVGDTVPVCIEAFLFFGFVDMDILTLASMIIAAVA